MKAVSYRHNWGAQLSIDEEMKQLFGELLTDVDTSEPWEVETCSLFKASDGTYTLLSAEGCSCWDGDYEGWSLDEAELRKWAHETMKRTRDDAEKEVARWIIEHLIAEASVVESV